MSGEWVSEETDGQIGQIRWFHRWRFKEQVGDVCGTTLIIDRNLKRTHSTTGRVWEWYSLKTGWQTFPPNVRTFEQRKAYAMLMWRMS